MPRQQRQRRPRLRVLAMMERKTRTWDEIRQRMERIAQMPGKTLLGSVAKRTTRRRNLYDLSKKLQVQHAALNEFDKSPEKTIEDGGGEIVDVLACLAAACEREGFGWRFCHISRDKGQPATGRVWLEVQHSTGGGGWKQMGPEGVW